MPELPDVSLYVDLLRTRIVGSTLQQIRIYSPFVLRTFDPPIAVAENSPVTGIRRLGKRIVVELSSDLFILIHLMIAGRFRWHGPTTDLESGERAGRRSKINLAAFRFSSGTLTLTEAGTRKRAALHIIRGEPDLLTHDPGGLDVLTASPRAFAAALRGQNHTLKRALTDPRILDGIGNAYSDEILHAAAMSPLRLTSALTDGEIARLLPAAQSTLGAWIARLRAQFGLNPDGSGTGRFPGPGDITAFRPGFAVHGRFGKPCPGCGNPVQRIVYAENETNYCAVCQTGGKVLADRSMSRLLRDDWPRTIEEMEAQ